MKTLDTQSVLIDLHYLPCLEFFTYISPFSDYRPLGEDKNTAWKDANDTVGKIGGWRAYAREAAQAMKVREAGQTKKAPGAGEIDKTPPATTAPKMSPALPATTHKHGG